MIHSMKEKSEWKGTRDKRAVLERVVTKGFSEQVTVKEKSVKSEGVKLANESQKNSLDPGSS